MSIGKGIILLGVITLLTGLTYIGYGGYLFKGVCVKMKKFSFGSFTDEKGNITKNPLGAKWATIIITMSIYNPSYLGLTLTNYLLNVTINGYPIALLQSEGSINIKKNQFNTIELKIPIDLKGGTDIVKNSNIPGLLATGQYSQVSINMQGTVTFVLSGITINYPLNITETVQDIINMSNAPDDPNSPCQQQKAA